LKSWTNLSGELKASPGGLQKRIHDGRFLNFLNFDNVFFQFLAIKSLDLDQDQDSANIAWSMYQDPNAFFLFAKEKH
jgi:hypothetical protein